MDRLDHLVARVNVSIKAGNLFVRIPKSKLNLLIVDFLLAGGYILNFVLGERVILIVLNSFKGRSVLGSLVRVSKPGRRVYVTGKQLSNFYRQDRQFVMLNSSGDALLWIWELCMLRGGGEVLLEVNGI